VLFQLPANLMLSRLGARAWLSTVMAVWGLCTVATAFVTGEVSFVVARFALGVAEAGFLPGVAYFMTCWFPGHFRGRMMGIFFAAGAFASVIGAPLGSALLQLDGWLGLQGWQFVFLVEGLPAVLLAIYGPFALTDRPSLATWLLPDERTYLQHQLDAEAAAKTGANKGLWASLISPQIAMLMLAYFFIGYGVYALAFFLPLIVKSLGVSTSMVGWLLVLPNLCGSVGMILVSRRSDRTRERVWHTIVPVVLAGVGTIAAALLLDNIYLAMAAFCLSIFGIASCLPVFWNLPTAYLGAGAAAGGIAFINSFGNIAGYVAPQITGLLRDSTGGYQASLLLTGTLLLLAGVAILASGIRRHVLSGTPALEQGTVLH
jgi:ACS family tartrate transporter-like MFS transporter